MLGRLRFASLAALVTIACTTEPEPLPTIEEAVEVCEAAEVCLIDTCGDAQAESALLNEQLTDVFGDEADAILEQLDALSDELDRCKAACIPYRWHQSIDGDCNVGWSTGDEANYCAHLAASRAFSGQGPCEDHLAGPLSDDTGG